MFGFLRTPFSKRAKADPAKTPSGLSPSYFENMPVSELISTARSLGSWFTLTFDVTTALIRRLHSIALFDNHVAAGHRQLAGEMADGLIKDLERSLNATQLQALNKAVSNTKELARKGGYGSLAWQLREFAISSQDTIPYVMKPQHRHLVPDFVDVVGPDAISSAKPFMLREGIRTAKYHSDDPVLILHGLAASGDKALVCRPKNR